MSAEETWKDIPGYEHYYQASDLGAIRSVDRVMMAFGKTSTRMRGRILKTKNNKANGYLTVNFSIDGIKKTHAVHRLVCSAWHDNHGKLKDVNHKNGNKHNNSAINLEWCTRSTNLSHAYKTGLKISVRGTDVWTNKLTESQVREIYHSGGAHREIAERYGVKKPCVWAIKNRIRWRHLDMEGAKCV